MIRFNASLSGKGFFEIRRSTLTSMFSICCTYLVILLQFTPR